MRRAVSSETAGSGLVLPDFLSGHCLQRAFSRRKDQIVGHLFSTERLPVETDTGVFSVSGRGIGLNLDLRNVTLTHREKRGTKVVTGSLA